MGRAFTSSATCALWCFCCYFRKPDLVCTAWMLFSWSRSHLCIWQTLLSQVIRLSHSRCIQATFLAVSSSSSSPLLSLVTSTSEITHQPVHTYTTYIYDKGIDRTGRQGIEENTALTWGKWGEKKRTPRLCSLGSTVWEQEKTPQHKSTHIINTRLLQQGKTNPAPASSHPVQQPFISAPVTYPLVRLAVQSERRRGMGGGEVSPYQCL